MKLITRTNIQNKLTLLLLLVSLTTVIASTLLAIRTVVEARQINVSELLKQLNQHQTEKIDKFINDKIETFRINVVDPGISRITKEQGDFILKTLLAEDKSITEASFLSPDGQEIIKRSQSRVYQDEELVNQQAQMKYTVPVNKKDYISEIYSTPTGLSLTLASPIVNQEGTVIAVLTGEVLLNPIKEIIEKVSLGKDGYFALINKTDGRVIFSSKSHVSQANHDFKNDLVISKIIVGDKKSSPIKSYRTPLGQKVIGAGQTLETLPWIALSQWPTGDAFAVVRAVLLQIFIILILLAAALVVIARLVANAVVKPITVLKAGAAAIGQGKFGHQIEVKTGDEIEELAQDFNAMSLKLKEQVDKIIEEEKKVAKAKDEFVFIAAHELRSPVTVIKGYVEILAQYAKKFTTEAADSLQQIKAANDRLLQLVQDLLEVARSDAGTLKIEVAPVDNILAVTTELVDQYKQKVKEAKVNLSYSKPASIPPVMSDPNRFKQVLGNLVDNAIKYNKPGGKVEVTQQVKEAMLHNIVTDTGFGMSPNNLKKLFGKFFRAQEKGTEQIAGTGLGLWITKELVERQGGKIWATSTLGKGSTFIFTLPLAPKGAKATKKPSPAAQLNAKASKPAAAK